MSEIRMAYPAREMLELVEQPTANGVPHYACWWRLRLLPYPDGIEYHIDIDNIDALDANAETTITYRFSDDGRTEVVEPYAAQITTKERDDSPSLGSIIRTLPSADVFIDALCFCPPTSNPRWEQLTKRGNHRHPNALEEIARRRAAKRLPPLWIDDLIDSTMRWAAEYADMPWLVNDEALGD